MAILKMKKIRLCGIAEEQDQLIRELQLLGSVEIGSPEALTEAQQTQLFRTADGAGADALSQTSAALASALETLKHYETKKGGMFSARPEKTLGELFDDDAYRAAVQTAQEALDTQDARSRNQAEREPPHGTARELRAVADARSAAGNRRDAARARAARYRSGADRA